MSPRVTRRPRARVDLLEQFVYFGERATVELVGHYLAAVEKTCLQLASRPLTGSPYAAEIESLKELRRHPIKGFENYWLFYLPRLDGIDVIRVLHAARDIASILPTEEAGTV